MIVFPPIQLSAEKITECIRCLYGCTVMLKQMKACISKNLLKEVCCRFICDFVTSEVKVIFYNLLRA